MIFLKQSTASQSVLIGPFVDDTDGATPETALTIANTDIRLSANGGNMAAKNSGGGTHDEAGMYAVTLDATDTATVGSLQLSVKVAGALYVFHDFQVLEEAIYDELMASGATGELLVDVAKISGDSTAADNLELQYDGTGLTGDTFPANQEQVGNISVEVRTEIDSNSTQLAAIVADTNELQTDDVPGLIAALNNVSVADLLTTQMTEAYASDGTAPTLAQAIFLIQQTIGDFSISGTTLTAKKLDGSTTAATYTLNDAANPTSRTRST